MERGEHTVGTGKITNSREWCVGNSDYSKVNSSLTQWKENTVVSEFWKSLSHDLKLWKLLRLNPIPALLVRKTYTKDSSEPKLSYQPRILPVVVKRQGACTSKLKVFGEA